MRLPLVPSASLALLLTTLVPPLAAQHEHTLSPYAHLATDAPPLLPEEVERLRAGEGMGLALPAELNGFPGPKHVLELAAELELNDEQRERIGRIREDMLDRAVAKGEQIIDVAGRLADAFRTGEPTAAAIEGITAHLGSLRGELQAIHLAAHLTTRDVLTIAQVAAYGRLRGYDVGR